ncbi:AraC family transcriptional regulator [Mesorhizobium sp. B2-3-5]|nr:AraC family transcriptional regulator [Mesorhizobium sp. B2-3-5]
MDWLSRLLDMMPVTGRLDIRCFYAAPWRIAYDTSQPGVLPYHVVLSGSALLESSSGGPPKRLVAGDILVLATGGAHTLHDGSGIAPGPAAYRPGLNHTISENAGSGERLDLLCGHFTIPRPHDRLMREYLPPELIVRSSLQNQGDGTSPVGTQLANLVALMRSESDIERLGGTAMLNAFSAALFTLSLRLASESKESPSGLLALAGHPRLTPALAAMFHNPAHAWTLPELADLCNMSRATFARHFQEKLGRSASDLLLDIRMALAANELRKPGASTAAVAEAAGYQSEAAFQRTFKQKVGVTPSQWRRAARTAD